MAKEKAKEREKRSKREERKVKRKQDNDGLRSTTRDAKPACASSMLRRGKDNLGRDELDDNNAPVQANPVTVDTRLK